MPTTTFKADRVEKFLQLLLASASKVHQPPAKQLCKYIEKSSLRPLHCEPTGTSKLLLAVLAWIGVRSAGKANWNIAQKTCFA